MIIHFYCSNVCIGCICSNHLDVGCLLICCLIARVDNYILSCYCSDIHFYCLFVMIVHAKTVILFFFVYVVSHCLRCILRENMYVTWSEPVSLTHVKMGRVVALPGKPAKKGYLSFPQ